MSRSVKKGPFVQERLLARIHAMNESGKTTGVKTGSRASTIFPEMVDTPSPCMTAGSTFPCT